MSFRFRPRRGAVLIALALSVASPGAGVADISGPYLAARSAIRANEFTEAATYFARAVAAEPSNQGLLEGALIAQIGKGSIDAAIPIARRLVSLGNRSQSALIVLLADQLARKDYVAALNDLNAGRRIGPLLDGLVAAWAEFGNGRMSDAITGFDAIAAAPGLRAFGNFHKALALGIAGDFEGAHAALTADAGGFRQTRRGAIAHAQILSQLDRWEDALSALDGVFGTDHDPEIDALRAALRAERAVPFDVVQDAADGMAEVFFTLAIALQGEAQDGQTLVYARVTEFLRPDHVDGALMSAALLSALGQLPLAIAAYERIAEVPAAALAAELGRAEVLAQLDRGAEAVAVLRALAQTAPDYVQVHMALGDMLRRQEAHAEATEAYSRAVDMIGPPEARHWTLFYSRAICYERIKAWDKAEPDFRTALELNPDQPAVLNYLGYSFLELNRNIDEAMELIKRAVAQRPDEGYIIDSLAWGYFLIGRYGDAVDPMERASLLMPVDPVVTDHLGDVYWAVGRRLEANFQWRRALSFDPDADLATRIRRKIEVGLDAVLAEEGAKPLANRGQ